MSMLERTEALSKQLSSWTFPLPAFGLGDQVVFVKPYDGPSDRLIVAGVRRKINRHPEYHGEEWRVGEWQYMLLFPSQSSLPDWDVLDCGGFSKWGWTDESRLARADGQTVVTGTLTAKPLEKAA